MSFVHFSICYAVLILSVAQFELSIMTSLQKLAAAPPYIITRTTIKMLHGFHSIDMFFYVF